MKWECRSFSYIEPSINSVWVLELFSETFASADERMYYETDALAN